MKTLGLAGLVLLAIGCAFTPAYAQDTLWTNKTSGNWSDSDKWFPNVPPGPGTNALLTNNAATSYTVTNDVVNNTFANLTLLNRGTGTNTLLNNASGFNPAGNVIIGRNGLFDLNGLDVSFGGSLTVSNIGKIVVRGAGLVTAGNAALLGSLVITNNGLFQVGASASGLITSNTGAILLGSGGTLAAGVITNTGVITTVGAGAGAGVITGSVANLRATGVTLGLAGINVAGGAGDSTLSLVGPSPFLDNVNRGTIVLASNGTLNVGGTSAGTASGSLTNRGTITFIGEGAGYVSTLNAGSLVNETNGTLSMPNGGSNGATNWVNADVLNRGLLSFNSSGPKQRNIRSLTNEGVIDLGGLAGSVAAIQQGDLLNEAGATITKGGSANTLSILNGGLINSVGGVVTNFGRGILKAAFLVQDGTFIVNNSGISASLLSVDGVTYLSFTNNGTLLLFNTALGSDVPCLTAGTLYNNGTILYRGNLGATNGIPLSQVTWYSGTYLTNNPGGLIVAQSNVLAAFELPLINLGTITIESNSVLSAGHTGYGISQIGTTASFTGGSKNWTNNGAVNMAPGAFLAVKSLTNSGAISGGGFIGPIGFLTITNVGGSLTQYVQNVSVAGVLNSGSINPSGTLNVGSITNFSGGSIVGQGRIQSLNVTNYFTGLTVTTQFINVNAKIQNQAGATILADGGTLTLANGFVGNTQLGTIGATNGGVLKIGDGSQALTNKGAIWLSNGRLECGDLTVTNGSVSVDLDNLASSTNGLIQTPSLTLGGTGTLTLTGSGNKAVLIRYSGTRSGEFATVTGVPPGYRLLYGPAADGSLSLIPNTGAMILVR